MAEETAAHNKLHLLAVEDPNKTSEPSLCTIETTFVTIYLRGIVALVKIFPLSRTHNIIVFFG